MDAVQRARSGHPGMPMGMADIASILWRDYLRHDPTHPEWPDRDRFVLSNGHGSMLLYSLLHLSGYSLSLDDLRNFRQLHSKTPGHPEYGQTPGVEATTGPLGQGLANSVGMALAEKMLAARFNRARYKLFDHYTYTFVGDGCLMEGISHEAASLAGTLGLGKLVVFYDDNGISIDGRVENWFTDDTAMRFKAYGWHVVEDINGHDEKEVRQAIDEARAEMERPSLLRCKTVIGRGAPNKQGTAAVHGAPLGEEEVTATREALGWGASPFVVSKNIYRAWNAQKKGRKQYEEWKKMLRKYCRQHEERGRELMRRLCGDLPRDFDREMRSFIRECQGHPCEEATRKQSQVCLEQFSVGLPELVGGSADLSASNGTRRKSSIAVSDETPDGNYIYYGVREFAMSAILNGLALHGGFIPFGGTFLVFSDYARNALRLAAMMRIRSIFIYTHDSIALGEDGPTHQPVEHLASLRMIPGLSVWRPGDMVETATAWRAALSRRDGPTVLVLTRQVVPPIPRDESRLCDVEKGAYILHEPEDGTPEAVLIATGSEVSCALEAARLLAEKKRRVRVVSMPSADAFEAQEPEYKEAVLPRALQPRVAVEASHPDWWHKYVGLDGAVVGVDRFGASAPGKMLVEHYGITAPEVVKAVNKLLS